MIRGKECCVCQLLLAVGAECSLWELLLAVGRSAIFVSFFWSRQLNGLGLTALSSIGLMASRRKLFDNSLVVAAERASVSSFKIALETGKSTAASCPTCQWDSQRLNSLRRSKAPKH